MGIGTNKSRRRRIRVIVTWKLPGHKGLGLVQNLGRSCRGHGESLSKRVVVERELLSCVQKNEKQVVLLQLVGCVDCEPNKKPPTLTTTTTSTD